MKKTKRPSNQAKAKRISEPTRESLKARCARLRAEAEAVNDDASATFFTAMFGALSLRIPEELKGANLFLLLDRKFE